MIPSSTSDAIATTSTPAARAAACSSPWAMRSANGRIRRSRMVVSAWAISVNGTTARSECWCAQHVTMNKHRIALTVGSPGLPTRFRGRPTMTDSFAVHLGGGAYLDASGKLVFGSPDNAQIYQAPGGFRLDTKKIQDAFKDLSGLLPADDAAKKKWTKWGVPADVVDFLAKIAGVASIVATAISVYVWAIGVLIAIMDLMTADDGMSPELAKTLYSIKSQLQGLEQIQRADSIIAMQREFDGRIDRVRGLLIRLVAEKPVGAARAAIFADMRAILDELAVPLSRVRDQEWAVTYNADAYKGRGFGRQLLVFQRSDGTTPSVPMVPDTVTHFDYRLGVPMLLYAATTFTAL